MVAGDTIPDICFAAGGGAAANPFAIGTRAPSPTRTTRVAAAAPVNKIRRCVARSAVYSEPFMSASHSAGHRRSVQELSRASAARLRISICREVGSAIAADFSNCVNVREIVSIVSPR